MSPDVVVALKVADGVEAAPSATDSILTANNLTRSSFDSLMYRIAADSTLSRQYNTRRP